MYVSIILFQNILPIIPLNSTLSISPSLFFQNSICFFDLSLTKLLIIILTIIYHKILRYHERIYLNIMSLISFIYDVKSMFIDRIIYILQQYSILFGQSHLITKYLQLRPFIIHISIVDNNILWMGMISLSMITLNIC